MIDTDFNPVPGRVEQITPNIRRILAPNASPMTFRGTNTYLVGRGNLAIIDPGPNLPSHLDSILQALGPNDAVSHILVTHSHLDHSPLARQLSDATGAPVYAFGNSLAGRSKIMQTLADRGLTGGGEGVDHDFLPDKTLADGQDIILGKSRIKAIWTPGHFGNHMCFAYNDIVFTGDLVMGWASTMISPPDGDLTAFLESCATLQTLNARMFLPGHGAPIMSPDCRIGWLVEHRKSRELQIVEALRDGPHNIGEITTKIYADLSKTLRPAAQRNVFAHLIDMHSRKHVDAQPHLSVNAQFALTRLCIE